MDKYINIGDSLIITVFSIIMVFLILVIISLFVSLLKNIDNSDELKSTKKSKVIPETISTHDVTESNNEDEQELIAVIAAAIAIQLHVNITDIDIRKIKQVPNSSNTWTITGRQEQMTNKL